MVVMGKLRKSARDQDCQIRIPNVCNFNPETTVLAHLGGAGMGTKQNDIHGAFACSACHDAIDGRVITKYDSEELELMHLEGVIRTQQIWLKMGLL
jgi:hypothetical protein